MKTIHALAAYALLPFSMMAAVTNEIGRVVLIDDAGNTRPAQSIATPAQVDEARQDAMQAKESADALLSVASAARDTAVEAAGRTALYSSNYVVTSTVYVQSIGGVPYDASNQLMRIQGITLTPTTAVILATCRQEPLSTPRLDWRQSLDGGAWTNLIASVQQIPVPHDVTNAASAYAFTIPRTSPSAFYRVVDNSTGASGSGLYWLVFGSIWVDGRRGASCIITNVVNSVPTYIPVKGGIIVNPEPL